MDKSYSETELTAFLEYVADKGLLNGNTAQGRKVAAQKVLSALDEHEKMDLRSIDREQTFSRFVNRFGKDFSPSSLKVYRSRFGSALDDFIRYQDNPAAFKPGVASSRQKSATSNGDASAKRTKRNRTSSLEDVSRLPGASVSQSDSKQPPGHGKIVFPIPLRPGVVVHIHDLPGDLTRAEAARIAAVVNALALEENCGD